MNKPINLADEYFKNIASNILSSGYMDENPRPKYKDGTPAHTKSINQVVRQYNLLLNEYPIMTLRPQAWKSAIKEILWIYQDKSNNLSLLRDKYNIHYWDDWDIGDGTIAARYGETVRRYNLIDKLIDGLKNDPFGRRHIMSLWQEDDFKTPGLNPCAFLTMWNVRKMGDAYFIDMTLVQRSGDMCCASGPGGINEIQYCALMLMICKVLGYQPGIFMHIVQNEQIYDRHFENALIMINRKTLSTTPKLILDTDKTNFYDFTINDFKMENYPIKEINDIDSQLSFELGI